MALLGERSEPSRTLYEKVIKKSEENQEIEYNNKAVYSKWGRQFFFLQKIKI